jgi:threonine dehydratase
MLTRAEIEDTAGRIAPHIRLTPVIAAGVPGVAQPVTLKLEQLQHTGSFKARGAFASLLDGQIPATGVAAASGGNHGAAVAFAARELGTRATIFVPSVSSPAKVSRIAGYGAEVVQKGATYADALRNCEIFVAESGARGVHAYDAWPTLRGQATLGRELETQAPKLDSVLVAVGGGGLIGGIAAWYGGRTNVVAVEPETCNALHAAMAAGRIETVRPSGVALDSLGASAVGSLMFEIAMKHVATTVLVSDAAIRASQRWLWDRLRIVSEPGGATALAALLCGAYRPAERERVGVILCGANTDPESFAAALAEAV